MPIELIITLLGCGLWLGLIFFNLLTVAIAKLHIQRAAAAIKEADKMQKEVSIAMLDLRQNAETFARELAQLQKEAK